MVEVAYRNNVCTLLRLNHKRIYRDDVIIVLSLHLNIWPFKQDNKKVLQNLVSKMMVIIYIRNTKLRLLKKLTSHFFMALFPFKTLGMPLHCTTVDAVYKY